MYTVPMNTFLATHNIPIDATQLLAARVVGGVFCLIFLFVLVFVCVHILKCAKIGWLKHRKKHDESAEKPPQKEKAPASPPEPIYYIVEKKRVRTKSKYSEPKEIRFK